jgi:DNA-binding transcriptional MerR regulator
MIYTIKEVTIKTGISAHTLRFYEKEGVVPFVKRDKNGNRIYDEENLKWLELMLCLRDTGMTLADIKHYVELYKNGDSTIQERKQMMLNHKTKIDEQIMKSYKYLEKINYKLALYDLQEKELKMLP